MFQRHNKKSTSAPTKPIKDLIAMVTPGQLLACPKRQELLQKIKEASSFESTKYEQMLLPLIHNLINHCQNLPETAHSYYALPAGLVDHALNRTEAALDLFRNFILQDGTNLSEEQKLWLYVLFTAGILQGIGKLQIDFRVQLFDSTGQLLKPWNPLLESLTAGGSYYQHEFQQDYEEDLRPRLNLLLARLIMPASGFAWIASNSSALTVWLALLNEDWQSAGTLGAILNRADAIAIQRYFNEFMLKNMGRGGRINRITTFVDHTPEAHAEKERLVGVEFILWLTKALKAGHIVINQGPLLMVTDGLLISGELFKQFIREHPSYKNWQAVQKGFLSLGVHRLGADGSVISRYEQAKTQQMIDGIVFSKYALALPDIMKIFNLKTGKIADISALEVANRAQFNTNLVRQQSAVKPVSMSYLTASGKWQPIDTDNPNIQPGNKRGG